MTGLFILSKDIYNETDEEGWLYALDVAEKRWNMEHTLPSPERLFQFNRRTKGHMADIERWAIIYVCFRELARIQGLRGKIVMIRNHYDKSKTGVTWDGDLMIASIHWDGSKQHGHLIYKTVESFRMFEFDYYIRSSLSSLIDLRTLDRVMKWRNVPSTKFYAAPFWDAGDWSYGAFLMCSKDIRDRMLSHPDPRWFTEAYPDDFSVPWAAWDMNGGVRYGFSFGSECRWNTLDCTYRPSETYFNRFGFSASNHESTTKLIEICNRAKQDKMFFFRANSLLDHDYVKMYKYFLSVVLENQ